MIGESYIGEAPRVPTVPELLAQMHALDVQIQQTDREIAARPHPAHPQGPKESAEWAELQTWWVNKHWRPFVAQWDRGMREVREYEAGSRDRGQAPLIQLITWLARMSERYNFLRSSAGGSFYIDVSTPRVSGLFDDIVSALKGAGRSVVSFVKHPPGWFATVFPLFTMENQRYWAGKLGGSTGEKIYDARVKAVAAKYLGPQGPQLVEAYNKVTEDAARGNLDAKEILAKAPEIAKLAAASNQGPDAFRAAVAETKSVAKVSGDEGERDMSAYAGQDYVGAEGQSYPEVAARAVRSISRQNPSPVYGYLRAGIQQRIYLFSALGDARGWFTALTRGQEQPYDYAAVFAATNLTRPVPGLESFGRALVSGDPYVGQWWPFFLGLPLGGLGGYFLRRWQEQHPGQALPLVPPGKLPAPQIPPTAVPPALAPETSGDPYVGGPWLDVVGRSVRLLVDPRTRQTIEVRGDYGYGQDYGYGYDSVGGPWLDLVGPSVGQDYGYDYVGEDYVGEDYVGQDYGGYGDYGYTVGAPWVDIVGAQADEARRREWPQTRALIQSAIDEVKNYVASFPAAEAYVWKLDAPSAPRAGRTGVIIDTGTTIVVPFSSQSEALNYLREVAQTRPVALAMFERSSPHWPNPTAWRKSDQPEHEQVIAQHVASRAPTQTSGTYTGAEAQAETAIAAVRRRAQQLAERRAGTVVGVIHTSKDGLWHTLAFRSADDADDWLNTATQDQSAYTYAAYFDKDGDSWPNPYIEKIGGFHTPKSTQRFPRSGIVGAAIDDQRTLAKQYASRKPGAAAGAILTAEGRWRAYGFTSLDDAIDWLQQATREKTAFIYAAAFEKDRGGTAYIQDEEFGGARAPATPGEPIRREIATTSGEDAWWAA